MTNEQAFYKFAAGNWWELDDGVIEGAQDYARGLIETRQRKAARISKALIKSDDAKAVAHREAQARYRAKLKAATA